MPQTLATVPGGLEDTQTVPGVATDTPEYYCLLTQAGAVLEAAAHAAGKPVRLSVIAVGDGNGEVPVPADDAVDLVHEVYRRPIDSLSQDADDPNVCWAHIVIPATEGGFWIREFGVWAEPLEEDGQPVLFAYGNHAPFYKAKSVLGQATTHELSVPVIMSGTAEVQIIVSESGYASRLELLQIAGVVEDLRHPREAVWTLDEAVEDGGTLTLPEGVAYLPGEHLLDVFLDGVACYPGQQYEEISSADALESTAIRLLFAAPAGSEMRVLVRAYSIQPELEGVEVPEGIAERVDALETRLEDVAANVAYIKPSHE
nr:MAG TPA: tail collar fiber protein [Caudoviricetes sp.]